MIPLLQGNGIKMVQLHLPSCFNENPKAQQLIGSLVIQYGELEYMLCNVVGLIIGDEEVAVKAMYRVRGETSRLQIASALVSSRITESAVKGVFQETMKGISVCKGIRNTYAHAHWFSVWEGAIGYYDLEGIAKSDDVLKFDNMGKSVLDLEILRDQERYFAEVLHNLVHMFYELDGMRCGSSAYTNYISPLKAPKAAKKTPAG